MASDEINPPGGAPPPAAASPSPPPPPVPAASARMPLLEHLKELRGRLIRSVIAIAVGFLIAYFRADWL